jgi:NIMA (never in mitosis gene a)-related kinase 1/4/5
MLSLKDKDKRNTLSEVRILASVDHPNIVQYREAIFDEKKGELALVMELAEGGDLADKIKTRFQRG